MKKVIFFYLALNFISCGRRNEFMSDPKSKLGIEYLGFLNDTNYLKQILPPFDLIGNPIKYSNYTSKYLKFRIVNQTDSIIFLYMKGYNNWPVDTLMCSGIIIDSFTQKERGVYESARDLNVISDNFDLLLDSVLPGNSKIKLTFFDKKFVKLKGTFYFGSKSCTESYLYKNQEFVVNAQ